MKHTKKLIPAIGMLLLSACMLVTSTFAWFSMNDVVTATDMTIAAKGDQVYLQIICPTNGIDGENAFVNGAAQTSATAAATSATGEQALQPTAVKTKTTTDAGTTYGDYAGGNGFVWVYASGIDAETGTVNDKGYNEVKSGSEGLYYLTNTFQIRLDATAGKEVAAGALKVAGVNFAAEGYTPDALGTSVSVLVVCGTNSQLWTQAGTDGTFTQVTGSSEYLDANAKGQFANTTGVDVKVYVFFNGDDTDCTLANLAEAKKNNYNSYSVEVSFTVAGSGQGA